MIGKILMNCWKFINIFPVKILRHTVILMSLLDSMYVHGVSMHADALLTMPCVTQILNNKGRRKSFRVTLYWCLYNKNLAMYVAS